MSRRIENIRAGADELARWLIDTVQLGTAQRHSQSPQEWQKLAARMIDAQSKGFANRVLGLSKLFEQVEWQENVLNYIGELYFLCQSFHNYDRLPAALQNELLNQAGVGHRKKDVLMQEGLVDDWLVLGRTLRQEEKMEVQRTWLYSNLHQRYALFLEFAVGRGSDFETRLEVGSSFSGELVFYPSAFPLRAWFKEGAKPNPGFESPQQFEDIPQMLRAYTEALQQNPFLNTFPALINQLIPFQTDEQAGLKDSNNNAIPLAKGYKKRWHLLSISGGNPVPVFGEWNGKNFTPLGILDQAQWTRL